MSPVRMRVADAEVLERPGKRSTQIVSRRNAPTARITITRVVMQPGAISPRHQHDAAEQTWIVEQGRARLLTAGGAAQTLEPGDVVITSQGETHGVEALGGGVFVYLTVTTPPEEMAGTTTRTWTVPPVTEAPAAGRGEFSATHARRSPALTKTGSQP